MAVKDSAILDLLASTKFEEHKNTWTWLGPQLQDYIFFNMLSKRKNIKIQNGSMGLEKTLLNGSNGRSRWVGLFAKDQVNIVDLMRKMRVEWKHITDACAYERREFSHQTPEYIINDIIKPRRQDMMLRMVATLEEAFFGIPNAADTDVMYGLFYWLTKGTSAGFNGSYPTGFTDIAGVNLTQTPGFKNYTDVYTAVTKDDLITKMRKAFYKTQWRSPVSASEFTSETGTRRLIWTTYDVLSSLERIGESQNENLGRDLASMDGQILFKKIPVMPVPQFDSEGYGYDNANGTMPSPVVMIDLDSFFAFVDGSDNFHKTEAKQPDSHNQFNEFMDLSLNTFCVNRRANALLTYTPA